MNDDRLFTRPFVLVSMANLLQGVSFNLMLHLPGFLQDLGATKTEIGFIWGIASIAAIAIRPMVGRVLDTRGRRRIILLGNTINVMVVPLYLTVHELGPWVYAIRIVHGLAQAMLFTSLFTYAADQVPKSRMTQGLSIYGTSGLLSISIGGPWREPARRRHPISAGERLNLSAQRQRRHHSHSNPAPRFHRCPPLLQIGSERVLRQH